jgi:hypothetical protein
MAHEHDHHAVPVDGAAALNGILALLVADREPRANGGARPSDQILAQAGLSRGQIAAVTGRERHDGNGAGATAGPELSVIDRARITLAARAQD